MASIASVMLSATAQDPTEIDFITHGDLYKVATKR